MLSKGTANLGYEPLTRKSGKAEDETPRKAQPKTIDNLGTAALRCRTSATTI